MATKLHSFMDIFSETFITGGEPVELKKITIPIIQRDYAQGRQNAEVNRVRSRFLESLHTAVVDKPITLDFVYGDIDEYGNMTPLDGQQRLTTLFLLHWYAAKKEGIPAEEWQFLKNFSYETRYSARSFCFELIEYSPSFEGKISKEIINQSWFPLEWKKDPTISSMLVMIDAIDEYFSDVTDLWARLKNHAITFYFLPIKEMGLTDELYIKMNSRGKPLTQFEHFKAELEHTIRAIDETLAERIIGKIDREWTDLLWTYRNSGSGTDEDDVTDDEFLNYFKFICDVICFREGESPQGRSYDEFELLKKYFTGSKEYIIRNIGTLESFFDCWCEIRDYSSPSDFLASVMSAGHESGKIVIENRYNIDIFNDCLHLYMDRKRFPLNRFVLLYAVTCYLKNQSILTHTEFARRLRIINNLILNSSDQVSDRIDRNRIPAILQQTEAVILAGKIDDSIENSFNANQLQEEKEKIEFLELHPEKAEELFILEDHPMLKGQIAILGLENLSLSNRFFSLFECGWDNIDCAMMATGNYSQQERNRWRYQFASKSLQIAWDELFHRSANSGFEKTKEILVQLLTGSEIFSNDSLKEIAENFTRKCEQEGRYPWRYYYIKYPVFRPGSYGKMSNENVNEKPYMFSVMQTQSQWSPNTYMPYLKAADAQHVSRDDLGQRLIYPDRYIICDNDSYLIKNRENDEIIEQVKISQNEDGIDTEDRIQLLIKTIDKLSGKPTPSITQEQEPGQEQGQKQEPEQENIQQQDLQELKKKFNQEMVNIYKMAKKECGYTASRFLQMIGEIGEVEAAKKLIRKEGGTEGFAKLWEHNRLDLSVEAHVLKPEYAPLFSEEERKICRDRLTEFNYKFE